MSASLSSSAYSPCHPWFYVLGGVPLTPKRILEDVRASKYRGYKEEDIVVANGRCEPRRSQELRQLRALALANLREDLSRYRRVVFQLREFCSESAEEVCADVHVSVGLKHAHIYNEFAHLIWIDELLTYQLDLFEC